MSNQLPDLSEEYPLAKEQITSYQRDGHVLLRAVASPHEVAAYRPVLARAVARYNTETRPIEERDTYGKAFLQIMNLWRRDEQVRHFVLARRFARIAARLMGVEAVRLYHDQALYKEASGGPTPWHQDQYYWPLDTDRTITMWMPLVDVSAAMGPMRFASGSHRQGYLGSFAISDESESFYDRLVSERSFPTPAAEVAAGDATFHSGWTLHCAGPNKTPKTREVMTIIYFADGVRVGTVDNANRQADLETWLPGLQPGDLAASPINPRL